MELFKMCSKRVFINRYCTTKIFFYKDVCSKQVGVYFLVYSSLISIVRLMLEYKKCVFKASGNLLFSLLSYFVHESIRNFCFLIIIRNYFVWKNLFFSDERDVELYLTLVFRKFAKQAKSALIPCYENFFILRLISSHPGVWNFFYFTLKFNFKKFLFFRLCKFPSEISETFF